MNSDEPLLELLTAPPPFATLERPLDGPYLTVIGADLPIAVQVGRTDTGRLVCTGVHIGWADPPQRVTASRLRSIRIGELVEQVERVLTDVPDAPLVARRRGRKGWPDSHYRTVADTYRHALDVAPGRHVQWMADELHASVATVHRWLGRARDKGLLERSGRRGPR